ncbi:MAG: L-lactate permease [Symbiobacteriaceae bacterium]|jgi:lactate permease|nr:L-lactate permease [Symbiobacteriaceae bacterium]
MQYLQNYNPLGNAFLSTLVAALPVVTLLYFLALHPSKSNQGSLHKGIEAHKAALIAGIVSLLAAVFVFKMPVQTAGMSYLYGVLYGMFPIGWIVIAAMFLYTVTLVTGQFEIVKDSVASMSSDKRIQAILIAFSFGAFVEGAAGFGTPVAISGALMVGLGFKPLQAAILCLIANTAPVAFGALGTPVTALEGVTGIPAFTISQMAARQLPFFSLIVPVWMVAAQVKMDGGKWSDVWNVWPALLVSGGSFAITQFAVGNYMGHMLVDILGGLVSMAAVAIFSRFWQPKQAYSADVKAAPKAKIAGAASYTTGQVIKAWMPWALLTVFVFLWGYPDVKNWLNSLPGALIKWNVPFVQGLVFRTAPVVAKQTLDSAVYSINWLSAPGTGILISALISGLIIGMSGAQWVQVIKRTAVRLRLPLLTIGLVLGMGYVTKYSGMDAVLGLAFTKTGWFYPFFAAMLGWLGVALTGSDTSANVMFGGMQKITAEQLGLSPVLICTANSTGGVMGKMIDAQSIVVATAACYEDKNEGKLAAGPIFRGVLPHSLLLAALMGILVMLQAYVFPWMIPAITK